MGEADLRFTARREVSTEPHGDSSRYKFGNAGVDDDFCVAEGGEAGGEGEGNGEAVGEADGGVRDYACGGASGGSRVGVEDAFGFGEEGFVMLGGGGGGAGMGGRGADFEIWG